MNAKISVFVICVEAMIYLLLYKLHDRTFKETNWLISKGMRVLLFDVFNGCSLVKK